MDLAFSFEQQQLRDGLRRYLLAEFPFELRAAAARSSGRSPAIWQALSNRFDVLGLAQPGAPGGAVEQMIVAEELGRALSLEPFTETAVMAAHALASAEGALAADVLGAIATGNIVVACALFEPRARLSLERLEARAERNGTGWRLRGAKNVVAGFPSADWLLVAARTSGDTGERAGLSLFLVEANARGIEASPYPTIDGRRAADLRLVDVALGAGALVGPEGGAIALLEAMVDRGIAAGAAESVGTMQRALAETLTYTQARRQFGQTLAEMQVIQHRLADMQVQLELASAAALLATLKRDGPAADRTRSASAARIVCSKAMRFVGQNTVQLHGGMGVVDEMAVAHAFKRLTALDAEFGALDHHVGRREAVWTA